MKSVNVKFWFSSQILRVVARLNGFELFPFSFSITMGIVPDANDGRKRYKLQMQCSTVQYKVEVNFEEIATKDGLH